MILIIDIISRYNISLDTIIVSRALENNLRLRSREIVHKNFYNIDEWIDIKYNIEKIVN